MEIISSFDDNVVHKEVTNCAASTKNKPSWRRRITGVFFHLTSEIWLRKNMKPVFQPEESDSGVRISKKWGLVGPQGPWMSIFEGFWWISTFLAVQGPEMPYFPDQEEVDTVSEPVWCAENNGDSLEVQFWARRVRPGPWMSILGIFWQFPWFFPNFLSLFKYQRPYIVRTNEKQCYLYFENNGERLKAQFWILEGPWTSIKANFGGF